MGVLERKPRIIFQTTFEIAADFKNWYKWKNYRNGTEALNALMRKCGEEFKENQKEERA